MKRLRGCFTTHSVYGLRMRCAVKIELLPRTANARNESLERVLTCTVHTPSTPIRYDLRPSHACMHSDVALFEGDSFTKKNKKFKKIRAFTVLIFASINV